MRTSKKILCLVTFLGVSLAGLGTSVYLRATMLERRIHTLVGPLGVDCGVVTPVTAPNACVVAQQVGSQPYFVRYADTSEPAVATVFVRTKAGKLLWLYYYKDIHRRNSLVLARPLLIETPAIVITPDHEHF